MDTPRRVVTGHDENGRAVVLIDSGPGATVKTEVRAVESFEMWATDGVPVPIARVPVDPTSRPVRGVPGPNGTLLRIADIGPDPFSHGAVADAEVAKAGFAFMGNEAASQWKPGVHPGMHRTETVDYAVVLDGEIDMLLDDGVEVHLTRGDIVVQCGTNHAWVNRSDGVTRMLFVLIDGRNDPDLDELLGHQS